MQPYDGAFTEQALIAHLLGREAYRRTEFIVLHGQADAMAVVAIAKRDSEALFSEIVDVEVLALPNECAFARSPETDCSNRSALAELAHQHGVECRSHARGVGPLRSCQFHSPARPADGA